MVSISNKKNGPGETFTPQHRKAARGIFNPT